MTRYAKPVIGKKQAEEASSWSALKQTVVDSNTEKPKKKKKKLKNLKNVVEKVTVGPTVQQSHSAPQSEDSVIKKLKKKRNKQKLVTDAIKSELENTPKIVAPNKVTRPQMSSKQGKGSLKFSQMDQEAKKRSRADVHRNRRAAMDPCFVCRSTRHKASHCPKGYDKGIGICFKCASTEHTSSVCPRRDIEGFPHAKCFICSETGHLSRACPDNPRGLYPNGGCCKECGSVEHFAKDCQTKVKQRESRTIKLKSITSSKSNVEEDDMMDLNEYVEIKKPDPKPQIHKPKVVKF